MANPALVLLTLASVLAGFGDKEGTLKRFNAEPRFGVKYRSTWSTKPKASRSWGTSDVKALLLQLKTSKGEDIVKDIEESSQEERSSEHIAAPTLRTLALRIRCTNPESKQRDNNECRQKSIELAKEGNALLLDYNRAEFKLTKPKSVSSLTLRVNTFWLKSWDFSGPKVSRFQVHTLV
jgi:hypothetical protein